MSCWWPRKCHVCARKLDLQQNACRSTLPSIKLLLLSNLTVAEPRVAEPDLAMLCCAVMRCDALCWAHCLALCCAVPAVPAVLAVLCSLTLCALQASAAADGSFAAVPARSSWHMSTSTTVLLATTNLQLTTQLLEQVLAHSVTHSEWAVKQHYHVHESMTSTKPPRPCRLAWWQRKELA